MMKIVMIHGQSHERSTCMVARELADKVGGEVQEFFLPRDFARPCCGCFTCFKTDLSKCPHFKELEPLERAILDADLLILDSPVYVYHATGQMMSFLDHFGTWWVVHRPMPEMSRKQAVAISTAAGGGMKSTVRDMADSLEMWGIHKVYKLGVGVQAAKPEEIPAGIMKNIHRKTDRLASQIQKNAGARVQWQGKDVVLHHAFRSQVFPTHGTGLWILGGMGLAWEQQTVGSVMPMKISLNLPGHSVPNTSNCEEYLYETENRKNNITRKPGSSAFYL